MSVICSRSVFSVLTKVTRKLFLVGSVTLIFLLYYRVTSLDFPNGLAHSLLSSRDLIVWLQAVNNWNVGVDLGAGREKVVT